MSLEILSRGGKTILAIMLTEDTNLVIRIISRYIIAISITQIHRTLTEVPIKTQIQTQTKGNSQIIRLIPTRVRKLSRIRRILWNRKI